MQLSVEQTDAYCQRLVELIETAQKPYQPFVSRLNVLLNSVFNSASQKDKISFKNTYHKYIYIQNKFDFPEDVIKEMHGFRKFSKSITKDFKKEVSEDEFLLSIGIVAQVIILISADSKCPQSINNILKQSKDKSFYKKSAESQRMQIEKLRVVVLDFTDLIAHPNGGEYYSVTCNDIDAEETSYIINLWKAKENILDFSYLGKKIWKYARLNIYNISKRKQSTNVYDTTTKTQIVLEPDNVINSTDVAACFQRHQNNIFTFLLKKIKRSGTSLKALQGTLIGELLDEVIKNKDLDVMHYLDQLKEKFALQLTNYSDADFENMKLNIIENHLPNLVELKNKYQDKKLILEPTFISEKYGLLGRLDVLVEINEYSKDVIELKSGNAPKFDTWINHAYQAIGYNLLLKSTYNNRVGLNSIFYSKEKIAQRSVVSSYSNEYQLLKVRNFIAYTLHKLREGDAVNILSFINLENKGLKWPKFAEKDVLEFNDTFKNLTEEVKLYYAQMIAFLVQELLSTKTGSERNQFRNRDGFASLWLKDEAYKKETCNGIFKAQKIEYIEEEQKLIFAFDSTIAHGFRVEDMLVIYPSNIKGTTALNFPIVKAVISSIEENTIAVDLISKQVDKSYLEAYNFWNFEADYFENNYWSSIQSLYNFISSSNNFKDLIFGKKEQSYSAHNFDPIDYAQGNQNTIVKEALEAEKYHLIQGPPGTGKTSTVLVNIVLQHLKHKKGTITICAFTNRAVQEICFKLDKHKVDFIVMTNRTHPKSFKNKIDVKAGIKNWKEVLKNNRVFVSTLSSFKSKYYLTEFIKRDLLIVDEASQVTEAEIIGVVALFKKFILIGDQNQLPAVVTQDDRSCAVETAALQDLGIKNFKTSLFERLYKLCAKNNWKRSYHQLDTHFRMHDEIAELISGKYERAALTSFSKQQKSKLHLEKYIASSSELSRLLSKATKFFIASDKPKQSRKHDQEAGRIKQLVLEIKHVYGSSFNTGSVGVIAPWRIQVANIKNSLGKELSAAVLVDTVERFQGSEREIIILSLAVQNAMQLYALQSIDEDQRLDRKLLVALSRAKSQLVILGYEPVLRQSVFYREVIDNIKAKGCYVSSEQAKVIFGER